MSSQDWKVNDRVQVNEKDIIKVGSIVEVETAIEKLPQGGYNFYTSSSFPKMTDITVIKNITVKWDDSESLDKRPPYSVYPEDSEVERNFRSLVTSTHQRINEKLAVARAALDEAEAISEETGVPFSSGISPLSQPYRPTTLKTKFPDLDNDFVNDITGTYDEHGDYGWCHSAVC